MVTERTIYTYRCDRCGKEITGSVFSPIWGELDQEGDGNYNRDGDIITLDICGDCKEETERRIKELYKLAVKNDENGQIPTENGKKRKGRQSNLDGDKIMALRRAGWNYSQIAEEFGVSSWTIGQHVKKAEAAGAFVEDFEEGKDED